MKDMDGNEVSVGDSVLILSLDEASLTDLPEDERARYLSMVDTTEQIDEITDDGYATLGKWVEEDNGEFTYVGLALRPQEFRLVAKKAWRKG